MKTFRYLKILPIMLLVACGGGGGSDRGAVTTTTPTTNAPATTISGVAASGAALDGATVEIIDASGNLVDIPDTLTGADGSYQVVLPDDIALPVIIRITPPFGEPLISILPPTDDNATEIVANINPITNLVSHVILGDGVDATSNAGLAAALAMVDVTTVDETGDAVVEKLLGASVTYATFSSDSDFVANDPDDDSQSGSAADVILDTIAIQAAAQSKTLADSLAELNAQEEPPELLQQPGFQIDLVSLLITNGAAAADLEGQLNDIGAIEEVEQGGADVFRTIIAVVPVAIQKTIDNAQALSNDQDLLDIAVNNTVKLIADTVEKKADLFDATDESLVDLLNSSSFQETTVKIVAMIITPILETFIGDESVELDALEEVTNSIIEQASEVVSSLDFDENSTDVSGLVVAFVELEIVSETPLTTADLTAIAAGTGNVADFVTDVGEVAEAQDDIQNFAINNPTLLDGDIQESIEVIPTGTWDQSSWDKFNWSGVVHP